MSASGSSGPLVFFVTTACCRFANPFTAGCDIKEFIFFCEGGSTCLLVPLKYIGLFPVSSQLITCFLMFLVHQ